MRTSAMRAAMAAILLTAAGCGVSEADINHWKRTVRGPGKITAVLLGQKYPRALRVRAARALIEMKHPNANGLELLNQALTVMPREDREAIIHDLLEPLRQQMRGQGQQTAAGPTEQMIRAKDAAYVLLRHSADADRRELASELVQWVMADLNSRALAGSYTAEQVVQAVGAQAGEMIVQAINGNEDTVRVMNNIAGLIQTVGSDPVKDSAVRRMVTVCDEISGPASNARLRQAAERMLRQGAAAGTTIDAARIDRATDRLRDGLLAIMHQALAALNRPAGTAYFIRLASTNGPPIERRKAALSAIQGHVARDDAAQLLTIATSTTIGSDIELRGLAVDRIGETQNSSILPQLWQIFDTTNGGEANSEYVLRWKVGEAILKLGGAPIIPTFVQHLAATRATARGQAAFEGYTFREINGYAVAIGDFAPPPRDVMRQQLTHANVHIRAMALLFLGAKGDATDAARIEALQTETNPIAGPGWSAEQLTTLGPVARRAREALRRALNPGPAAATAPAARPTP
ncbi:MAG: hypothetical protein JNK05_04010 [Myxococcales bacterium]|nr:hypothetical protein [Myxococcales bacterium]